jgi:uncharacterized protein (DUF433 family)
LVREGAEVGFIFLATEGKGRMATQTAGVAEDLLDEPHVEGRRVSVLQLRDRVEEVGDTPQAVAEEYTLNVAAVYQALAYYHTHEAELEAVRDRRERETADLRREAAASRPEGVTPP